MDDPLSKSKVNMKLLIFLFKMQND